MVNQIQITKSKGENTASLLRKFTRKVRGSGIVQKIKADRFFSRKISEFTKKKNALMKIKKTADFVKLAKLGRIPTK